MKSILKSMRLNPPPPPGPISAEDYLRFEESAQTKHEFRSGQIVERSEITFDHSVIASNLIGEIGNRLDRTRCKVLGSLIRIRPKGWKHRSNFAQLMSYYPWRISMPA
jgi:Uma2 family endonuclease